MRHDPLEVRLIGQVGFDLPAVGRLQMVSDPLHVGSQHAEPVQEGHVRRAQPCLLYTSRCV